MFIVLSLVAALLLPINRIIEVKSLPTHRDSATLHSGVTDYHYLSVIPFVRVKVVDFLFEIGGNSWTSVSYGGGLSGGGLLVDFIVRFVVFVNVSSFRSRGCAARFCSYVRF